MSTTVVESKCTHLGHPLVKSIDCLERLRVRKGQAVRSQAHDVAVLLVQLEMHDFWSSAPDDPESPPVCEGSQFRAGILVEAIAKVVLGEPGSGKDGRERDPVLGNEGQQERVVDCVFCHFDCACVFLLAEEDQGYLTINQLPSGLYRSSG